MVEIIKKEEQKSALIVGVITGRESDYEKFFDELERLTEALDLYVAGLLTQELPNPNPATFVGSGKLDEIAQAVVDFRADYVIFSETLSPAQFRNISKVIKVRILDRTSLILEIFKERAKTREARLQVEMAELQYTLPRLVGMWTFFGRQGGGGGSRANKGAGEKQIELDRRTIEKRISELRRTLETIEHDRNVQRSARNKSRLPKVALVGYTNAGKSTVMNYYLSMIGAEEEKKVFEKDMLFATLDTSIRRVGTGDKKDFLLSDTVGFVSDLPHNLVKAFRSTLDEVRFADLLLIVVDSSDEESKSQIEVTLETLKELGADGIPKLFVMNKCDISGERPEGFDEYNDRIYVSAKTGQGMEELTEVIKRKVYPESKILEMIIPYSDGAKLADLEETANVLSREYLEEGTKVRVEVFR